MHGVFITGTSTDVGKTFIGVLLAKQLTEKNYKVTPRKPIESGCIRDGEELIPQDASKLKAAANYDGPLSEICPYRFEPPISPARAAHLADKMLTTEELVKICTDNTTGDFVLVEGAGGFYSPLAENGLNADLAAELQLPVLLVADDNLGSLNQVLLNIEAIKMRNLNIVAVLLNSTNEESGHTQMDNAEDLKKLVDCPVYTVNYGDNELPAELLEQILAAPESRIARLVS